MITIRQFSFGGKRAIIRVDFNVPLNKSFEVTDTTRITAAADTIKYILNDGGSVILMSHLGRPKSGPEEAFSLKHILPAVESALGVPVDFANDCIGEEAIEKSKGLKPGQVLLLENLRFYKEEEKGSREFAGKLAALADFYVNDAFGTAHRAHASTAVIAEFFRGRSAFGFLMASEVENIRKVMVTPQRPFTAIIGGAKVSSKLKIFLNLLDKVDHFIVGGGMVYTFLAAEGGRTGNSLVENEMLEEARAILKACREKGIGLHLPEDSVCATGFDGSLPTQIFPSAEIPEGYMGLDIGPKAVAAFSQVLESSRTILWNGPMGVFEFASCQEGTRQVGLATAAASDSGAFSLVGGGDSVAAVNLFHLERQISYISTGGGAMLEFIEGIELPGIAAIEKG